MSDPPGDPPEGPSDPTRIEYQPKETAPGATQQPIGRVSGGNQASTGVIGTESADKQRRFRQPIRRIATPVLVAISCMLVVLSTTIVWAHATLLNTDVFVGTVGPVFENHAVDAAVATRATNELFTELDIQGRLRDALPPKIGFVAVPVTNATKGFVAGELTKVLASPKFQVFWTNTLRHTHQAVVAVLRGQSTKGLSTSNGYIVLNAVPVINNALASVSGLASELTGKNVKLPTITSVQVPQKDIDKLSKALGVQLPSNFGQITLVHSKDLATVQRAVRAFDRLTILLPILTLAIIALCLWISVHKRRTLLQLTVVTAALVIVLRRIVIHSQSVLAHHAHNPTVAHDVLGQLLHGFFVLTAWVLGITLAILVVTLLSGPYRWAVAIRSAVVRAWHWLVDQLRAERRQRLVAWMTEHANVLQFGGAVVAGILLLIVSVSWISFLVIGVLVAAFEIYLQRLKQTPQAPAGT